MKRDFWQEHAVIGQGVMALNFERGELDLNIRKKFLPVKMVRH